MKKILSILLCIIICAGALVVPASAASSVHPNELTSINVPADTSFTSFIRRFINIFIDWFGGNPKVTGVEVTAGPEVKLLPDGVKDTYEVFYFDEPVTGKQNVKEHREPGTAYDGYVVVATGDGFVSKAIHTKYGYNLISLSEDVGDYQIQITGFDEDNVYARLVYYFGQTDVTSITVPSELNGKVITSIGANIYRHLEQLKEVSMPDTITTIEGNVFRGCNELETVHFSKNINSIGSGAFYGCTKLKNIELPDGVTEVSNNVFQNCTGLESITLGKSLREIGVSAFENCANLNKITLPDTLEIIGRQAFYKCTRLKDITLPTGIKDIGAKAFNECPVISLSYYGTMEQWSNIKINDDNEYLFNYIELYLT